MKMRMMCLPLFILLLSFVSSTPADERIREYLELRRLIGSERFEEAFEKCKVLLDRYPDYPLLYHAMGDICQYARAYPQSLSYLNARIADGEHIEYAYYGLSCVEFQLGHYPLAIRAAMRAIELNLSLPDCYWILAKSNEKLVGVAEALNLVTQICARFPRNAGFWYAISLLHWSRSNFSSAARALQNAHEADPEQVTYEDLLHAINFIQTRSPKSALALARSVEAAENRADYNEAFLLRSILIHGKASLISKDSLQFILREEISCTKSLGFFRWTALSHVFIASQAAFQGNFDSSLHDAYLACKYAELTNDSRILNSATDITLTSLVETSNYEDALKLTFSWLQRVKSGNSPEDIVKVLCGISWVFHEIGDDSRALEYAVEAQTKAEVFLVDMGLYVSCESALGLAQLGLGRYQSALNHFRASLRAIPKDAYWPLRASVIHGNIGNSYLKLGDRSNAARHFQIQMKIAQRSNFGREVTYALANIGTCCFLSRSYNRAEELYKRALAESRKQGNKAMQVESLRGLGGCAEVTGRIDDALRCYHDAIEIADSIGIAFGAKLAASVEDCRRMTGLLMRSRRIWDALHYAELSKVKQLRETSLLVQRHNHRISDSLVSRVPTGLRGPQKYSGSPRALESRSVLLSAFDSSIMMTANSKHDQSLMLSPLGNPVNIDSICHRMVKDHDATDLHARASRLPIDCAVVEFVVNEDTTCAFVLLRNSLYCFRLPIGRRELRDLMKRFSRVTDPEAAPISIMHPAMVQFDSNVAALLSEEFVSPLINTLSSARQLVIVPDDWLRVLPFEALPLGLCATGRPDSSVHRFVVERFRVSYLPSLIFTGRNHVQCSEDRMQGAIALATLWPPAIDREGVDSLNQTIEDTYAQGKKLTSLPSAVREVASVGEILGPMCEVVRGNEILSSRIREKIPLYRIVHIAGHSQYDPLEPARSEIWTSDNSQHVSLLPVVNLLADGVSADLVVLSGCSTGRISSRLGFGGFGEAAILAGASSVVASLWPVDDVSTADFMGSFYRYLIGGETKAGALQKAKLDLIGSGKRDPFLWAGFVLLGDTGSLTLSRQQSGGTPICALTVGMSGCLLIVVLVALVCMSHSTFRKKPKHLKSGPNSIPPSG